MSITTFDPDKLFRRGDEEWFDPARDPGERFGWNEPIPPPRTPSHLDDRVTPESERVRPPAVGGFPGTDPGDGTRDEDKKSDPAAIKAKVDRLLADPDSFNLTDINFSDPREVAAITTALRKLALDNSPYTKYQFTPQGVFDRRTGAKIMDFADVAGAEAAAKQAQARLAGFQRPEGIDSVIGPGYGQAKDDAQAQYDRLKTGITDEDRDAGFAYIDKLFGTDYKGTMTGLSADLDRGISGQEGLSDQERWMYERSMNSQIGAQQDWFQRQAESVRASSGSTMAFLAKTDEARRSLSDMRVQKQVEIMNADIARRQTNYEAKYKRYSDLLQQGRITAEEYMTGLRNDRLTAYNAAMKNIAQMEASYQTYLEFKDADLKVLATIAQMANEFYAGQITANGTAFATFREMAMGDAQRYVDWIEAITKQQTFETILFDDDKTGAKE